MPFREVQFPPRISRGAVGGPGFSTDVVTVRSGDEKRNANWSVMRHSWEVSYAVKTESDFKQVRAFFLSVGGKRDGFRFKDWADYQASIAEGVVQGITTTRFQLQKRYVSGDAALAGSPSGDDVVTTLRTIAKPLAVGFVLKDGATTLNPGAHYTIDPFSGIVTTTSSRTAANLTWSGEFDVPARFDTDELRATIVDRNQAKGLLLTWNSIPIVEIRVP